MNEASGETDRKRELSSELGRRLTELGEWMIIEGLVDPNKGTEFELWQFEDSARLDPESLVLDGPKRRIVHFGIPDPIETSFNEIAVRTILEEEGE